MGGDRLGRPHPAGMYSWFAPVQPAWGDCEVVDAAELRHHVTVLHSATLGFVGVLEFAW